MSRIFLSAFLLSLLTACGPDYIADQTYTLDGETWTYDKVLSFEAAIPDTAGIYNLWMEIEHGKDFSYQNLYTRISTTFPDQQKIEQLLSFELADKFGSWQGECGRNYCHFRIPIQESAFFSQAGTYTFHLEQYMRKDSIPNIKSIRFQVEDTGMSR